MSVAKSGLWERTEREAAVLPATRLAPKNVDWSHAPNFSTWWIPEHLTRLYGSEIYTGLTDKQRRTYNQHFALKIAEEFIWLETFAIVGPIRTLLKCNIPNAHLRRLLQSFVRDESCHTDCLWRLLQLARPDLYPTRQLVLVKPPRAVRWLISLCTRYPELFSSWCLFDAIMEEQTIPISQEFRTAKDRIDPLFRQIFALHAQDEARHCKIDYLIGEWLVAERHPVVNWLNARLLDALTWRWLDPDWGSQPLVNQLIADHRDLAKRRDALLHESRHMRAGYFAQHLLDSKRQSLTARNARRHSILDRTLLRLPKRITISDDRRQAPVDAACNKSDDG